MTAPAGEGSAGAAAGVGHADRAAEASRQPGRMLLDAVAVMDRLRSTGGCVWDAAQTHASLLQYLVEECYELVQAIEDGDVAAICEELGDVLLQVLFHARIAAESDPADGGFDIDDVASGLVDKLVRRHPHVFGTPEQREQLSAADQQVRWDELKKAERGRGRALDGVALGQPAAPTPRWASSSHTCRCRANPSTSRVCVIVRASATPARHRTHEPVNARADVRRPCSSYRHASQKIAPAWRPRKGHLN